MSKEMSNTVCPPMGGGKPLPPPPSTDREAYIVVFDGPDDPWDPKNWPAFTRHRTAVIVCFGALVATFDSALYAPGTTQASHHFGVGKEVGTLGTSLFVLGFALGPTLFAPASEMSGRKWPLIFGSFGVAIFSIASATSKDIQTLIITRFFAGVFGASPISVVPGVLSDLYSDIHRGTAISVYALTIFGGPLAAPFIGAFITNSYLGWRWTLYLPAILGFCSVILLYFFTSETHGPSVLTKKAAQIRRATGIWSIHAEQEMMEVGARAMIQKYFMRPLRMLATEPVVLLVSLYMSFIYGLLYGLLEAYPYVFGHVYGMASGVAELPFIALLIGISIAVLFIVLHDRRSAKSSAASKAGPAPEDRLFPSIVGAFAFTIGLFWFAWTAFTPSVHWMAATASGVITGFGLLSIFLPCFNYLVDAYLPFTASAVAANVMLRSSIAAGFPLFATQMFENLGVQWAGTLLGCLAAIMIPIPIVFRAYGASLRKKSKMLSRQAAS